MRPNLFIVDDPHHVEDLTDEQLISLVCNADAPMPDRVAAQYERAQRGHEFGVRREDIRRPGMIETPAGKIIISLFLFSTVAFIYAAVLYSFPS